MRNVMVLIIWLMFFCFNAYAESEVLFSSTEKFVVLPDKKNDSNLLMIYEDEKLAKIWNMSEKRFLGVKLEIDPKCSYWSFSPFVYHHPYLVNIYTTCFLDVEAGRIKFIGDTFPPDNNFSFIFLYQDDLNLYFLVNGRDFPKEQYGYIKVKVVPKDQGNQYILDLISEVPFFSGGMLYQNGSGLVHCTLATGMNSNFLYTLSLEKIKKLIKLEREERFSEMANKVLGPFAGLSWSLYSNGEEFLFYNNTVHGEYENYMMVRKDGTRKKVSFPDDCKLVGAKGKKWLLNCYQRNLVLYESLDITK